MGPLLQATEDARQSRKKLLVLAGSTIALLLITNVAGINYGAVIRLIPWTTLVLGLLFAYLGLRFVRAVERIATALEQIDSNTG